MTEASTLVIGLGNPYLTDDGVGVRVAEAVGRTISGHAQGSSAQGFDQRGCPHHVIENAPIEVTELSVGGLTLMERMVGYDRVILIDALVNPNGLPGNFHRLTLDDLRAVSPTQHSACPHDANLITALDLGIQMGLYLPEEIIIFAVEVNNVTDFGEQPTPAVAAAVPAVTSAVMEEIWFHPN